MDTKKIEKLKPQLQQLFQEMGFTETIVIAYRKEENDIRVVATPHDDLFEKVEMKKMALYVHELLLEFTNFQGSKTV